MTTEDFTPSKPISLKQSLCFFFFFFSYRMWELFLHNFARSTKRNTFLTELSTNVHSRNGLVTELKEDMSVHSFRL